MVRELGLEQYVDEVFFESSAEMPLVYNLVDCLLFPSYYEGFGMPVIESLACHTPVVVSRNGALPELCPSLTLEVNSNNIEEMADRVLQATSDNQIKDRIIEQAEYLISQYRADNVGKQILNLYQELSE